MIKTFFVFLLFIGSAGAAQAYLDPGTGSLIFQMVIGVFLAGLIAIKTYYHKAKNFLSSHKQKK
ncbi:hypothetical protein D6821_01075 [Candidatus Parcubacteria bacterium]|nr:MAG: hypothetical protein D6821_01075 [Candidatus Parcubacteria bacterium]